MHFVFLMAQTSVQDMRKCTFFILIWDVNGFLWSSLHILTSLCADITIAKLWGENLSTRVISSGLWLQ